MIYVKKTTVYDNDNGNDLITLIKGLYYWNSYCFIIDYNSNKNSQISELNK